MEARYDAVADYYRERFTDGADPLITDLADLLGPIDGQTVLDIACGSGRLSRELARRGATVTGVELSRAMLDNAPETPGVSYVQANVADPAWVDQKTFDAATCSFGLSDIDDLDGTLANVARALRTGGSFVFSILHPCFPGGARVSGAWPSDGSYYDERWWAADGELSALRRQVGANHRMLSTYVNALIRAGLTIAEMHEPAPAESWATAERADAARFPVYLFARCTRS
jgi:SAM-dependent methyltransferase